MNVRFGNEVIDCKPVHTRPSKFHLDDLIVGPEGLVLRVVTVQKDCPYIENLNRSKVVVIFATPAGTLVPINGMIGEYDVLRPRRR